jgi:hypothetical protein
MLRIESDHTNTWLRLRPKHTDGQKDLRALVCQQAHKAIYELLHCTRIWGITRDGQGCHHLLPTHSFVEHSHINWFPIYLNTMPMYMETTLVPLGL